MERRDIGIIIVIGVVIFIIATLGTVTVVKILNKRDFVKKMKPLAYNIEKRFGINPDILIAQAALESGWGKSRLTREGNNLFGIKASKNWIAKGYPVWTGKTKEELDGKKVSVIAGFRSYKDWYYSCHDFAMLISTLTRYDKLYELAKKGDIQAYGKEVTVSGYATDTKYSEALVKRWADVGEIKVAAVVGIAGGTKII